MGKIYTGCKFFKYVDGVEEPEIIRMYRVPEDDSKSDLATYITSDGTKKRMSLRTILDTYKMLRPDGIMAFSILNNGNISGDVAVVLSRLQKTQYVPFAVCRQGLYDIYSNNIERYDEIVHMGMSINVNSTFSSLNDALICTEGLYFRYIAVYLDDTLDGILKLFVNTKFNNSLKKFKQSLLSSSPSKITFVDLEESLHDLLFNNNFMYDFRLCFDIKELPFSIDETVDRLSDENTAFLENELKIKISDTYVVKYSKDINLNEIERDYILASSAQDGFSSVFIVGYDKY